MATILKREISKVSPLFYLYRITPIISLLFIADGCASSIPFYKRDARDKVLYVPFVEQKTDYCGPASLAMILNFWGVNITQDEIAREIYSPELKGALSIEMVLYAVQKGFEAEMYNGSIEDLKERIKAGFPLIVSHRVDKKNKRVHYLVAWGFNDDKGVIYVHSGVRENLSMDYQTFLKYWDQAENLTFFIHPKDKVYVYKHN